jgi:hypothetical protein
MVLGRGAELACLSYKRKEKEEDEDEDEMTLMLYVMTQIALPWICTSLV